MDQGTFGFGLKSRHIMPNFPVIILKQLPADGYSQSSSSEDESVAGGPRSRRLDLHDSK